MEKYYVKNSFVFKIKKEKQSKCIRNEDDVFLRNNKKKRKKKGGKVFVDKRKLRIYLIRANVSLTNITIKII